MPSDRPDNLNLGKDFLLLWGDTPAQKVSTSLAQTVTTSPVAPSGGGGTGGSGTGGGGTGGGGTGGGGTVGISTDMLSWILIPTPTRTTKYMSGNNTRSYSFIDTDAAWPAGFPTSGVFVWVKNSLGHPWDWVRYSNVDIRHWITENTDADMQAACVAAGSAGGCWGYEPAYKRYVVPVPFMPRFFNLGSIGSPTSFTIDTPGPNSLVRTTDCEATSNIISIGDVRGVTSGPYNMTWGGSIDFGAGPDLSSGPVIDLVNGVPTIQNDYYYGGTIAANDFRDKESTFYVQGFGRVAWFYYRLIGGVWQLQQATLNNILSTGTTTPSFSCGAGKPWWV